MLISAGAFSSTLPSTTNCPYLYFRPPFPAKINTFKPIFIPPTKAKKRDDDIDAGVNDQNNASPFNPNISSKLLIQSAITLFGLGFVDAGYSGDWSRIGAISKDTEQLIKMLALVVAPVCIFLVYALSAEQKEDS